MGRPAPSDLDAEPTISVPGCVRFPVELTPPPGFDPADPGTWPDVDGRLEWVGGRLLWMPPCGDRQQYTVTDVVVTLGTWARAHPEFVVGTNEAGMHLEDDTRSADAAVWRHADVGAPDGGFQHVPPVLAVEVAGRYDREPDLRAKAPWYLTRGVLVVWLVLPETQEVVVVTPEDERRLGAGETLPPHPALPGLAPGAGELFRQLGPR
jgi:Uma2 family endonuclease